MTAYSFEYNGSDYTMEFTRETVKASEGMFGIDIQNVGTPSLSNMENLFHASLLKHHPNIKPSTVGTLYELQADKVDMFRDLVAMYMETVGTLIADGEEGKGLSRKKVG